MNVQSKHLQDKNKIIRQRLSETKWALPKVEQENNELKPQISPLHEEEGSEWETEKYPHQWP